MILSKFRKNFGLTPKRQELTWKKILATGYSRDSWTKYPELCEQQSSVKSL